MTPNPYRREVVCPHSRVICKIKGQVEPFAAAYTTWESRGVCLDCCQEVRGARVHTAKRYRLHSVPSIDAFVYILLVIVLLYWVGR